MRELTRRTSATSSAVISSGKVARLGVYGSAMRDIAASEPPKAPFPERDTFGPLVASGIHRSPTFTAWARQWCEDDQHDRRATPRFADIDTLAEMRNLFAGMESHPFAHWDRDVSSPQPGKALEDHARAPATWARKLGLDPNELVAALRGSTTTLSLPGPTASMTGAPSTAFAYVLDDDRWPAATRRKAYSRQLNRAEPDGTVYSFKYDPRLLCGLP